MNTNIPGTALVLGAGASHPYGFSLGHALKEQIVEKLRVNAGFRSPLISCGHTDAELEKFAERLGRSRQFSIDAFLERAPEFSDLGKRCIVLQIASEEELARQHELRPTNSEACWYSQLYTARGMRSTGYRSDDLMIVTFNYDRSLENFLVWSLMADDGVSEPEAWSAVNAMNIIHFHGHLGDLPFGQTPTADELTRAARNIRIIADQDTENDPAVQNVRNWMMRRAGTIAFLGFGYHKENVDRLQISNTYRPGTFGHLFRSHEVIPIPEKTVLGTTVRMSAAQIAVAQERFDVNVNLGGPTTAIAEYLRDHVLRR